MYSMSSPASLSILLKGSLSLRFILLVFLGRQQEFHRTYSFVSCRYASIAMGLLVNTSRSLHFFIHIYSSPFDKHIISQTCIIISITVSYLLGNSELSFLQSFCCMVGAMISYRQSRDV